MASDGRPELGKWFICSDIQCEAYFLPVDISDDLDVFCVFVLSDDSRF